MSQTEVVLLIFCDFIRNSQFREIKMSLPLLPGNTFSSNPGRENFSKSHHFDVCNAINMNVGEYKVSDPGT